MDDSRESLAPSVIESRSVVDDSFPENVTSLPGFFEKSFWWGAWGGRFVWAIIGRLAVFEGRVWVEIKFEKDKWG